ncbi:hypothetical protein RvY_05981-2 [Ramazzottius varieornatus]|uniref:Urease domain-containing protein n=1 Tax=Ramazzottius varieornatus TaxID=947166 RepID=A0A1D1UWZ0_RAMVA|nr:hypothetical protein RvY_05981-2 [Ramazzottius varieornatus]
MILKGGQVAWAQMGMPNASIPTVEPAQQRKMFGAYGLCPTRNSILFTSKAGVDKDFRTKKAKYAVRNCSSVTRADMVLNHATPKLEVNPSNHKVYLVKEQDGKIEKTYLTSPPTEIVPLAQRYYFRRKCFILRYSLSTTGLYFRASAVSKSCVRTDCLPQAP